MPGNLDSLAPVLDDARHHFARADVCDAPACGAARASPPRCRRPPGRRVARGPLDRRARRTSSGTNVVGTFTLLEEARATGSDSRRRRATRFRFLHVSTDEVFGSLGTGGALRRGDALRPNSPYSASKAAADHLVRAWHHTYGLPVLTTNCSNNYGPYQFPEKLIPLYDPARPGSEGRCRCTATARSMRDWLHVDDHADALWTRAAAGHARRDVLHRRRQRATNIEVVRAVCAVLDELAPDPDRLARASASRSCRTVPATTCRYAIDAAKVERELGWRPSNRFDDGLRDTVRWYLENREWWERVRAAPTAENGSDLGAAMMSARKGSSLPVAPARGCTR